MKFGNELIPKNSSNSWDLRYYPEIHHNLVVFLIITHLHLQGKINDKKMNEEIESNWVEEHHLEYYHKSGIMK